VLVAAGVFLQAGSDYYKAQRELAGQILGEAGTLLGGAVRHETLALPAHSVAQGLHDLAERERAQLLIVGSTHRGALGRVLAGDTATALLHGSPCPVAIAPHAYQPPAEGLEQVGVAFDGREESQRALGAAAALASLAGARLRLLAVAEPPGVAGTEVVADVTYQSVMEEIRRELREALEGALASLPESQPAEAELIEGRTAPALSEAANSLGLLAVGSRGYGPLGRVLLGSTAAHLAHGAPCPLLVVPRGADWELGRAEPLAGGKG
jgi:nucleotide-binding universal stress UspA family protein